MNKVYIAFGTNIGEKEKNIKTALQIIQERGLKITKQSRIYKTEPYGFKNQPEFLNGVVEVETDFDCRKVLEILLNIEKDMGRVRQFKWGPRNIDLDIVFFNSEIINEDDLKVPHPDMHNREFVLRPMCDINPDFIHPILKKSMKELLVELEKNLHNA